ncbi:hypothetical protein F5X97DRAFT_339961 [Nemania serpens]|nr:hypothetical protein F5X97DRAFT_339961 [Nemania serpens]
MSFFPIALAEEGGARSSLRTRNSEGETLRDVLINQGNNGPKFIANAEIVGLVSGSLTENGPPATIIVFRFYFINLDRDVDRRFVSAKIKVEFGDARSRGNMDPVVYAISPDGETRLDKLTQSKDEEKGIHSSVNCINGLDFGFEWKVSQTKEKDFYAKQMGIKFNNRTTFTGSDNMAIWQLAEHTSKKQGIPSFLQTAVLLQRRGNDKIIMNIAIETETDVISTIRIARKRLFGGVITQPVDPVHTSSEMFKIRNLAGADELEENSPALKSMKTINMGSFTGVERLSIEKEQKAAQKGVADS